MPSTVSEYARAVDWESSHVGLDARGLIGFPLPPAERDAIMTSWVQRFCPNVFRRTGSWIHLGIRWHAYSYGFEVALEGDAAMAAYTARAARELLVYIEGELFDCFGLPSPDLGDWGQDLYVFPASLAWTMVFTHEQDTGLGPYFAVPPDA
jgi:hypothetical protein